VDGWSLEVDISDINALVDQIANPKAQAGMLDSIGATLLADAQGNFRSQSDPDGNPWAPTIRGGNILRDTGRLRNSLTYEVQGDRVTVGTNVLYAPVHQFGATITAKRAPFLVFQVGGRWVRKKSVTIPARPFLGIGSRQIEKMNTAIDAWLDDVLS